MKKLGFGLMRLPMGSAQPEDIDHEQLCRMVDAFLNHGFTYFDTSYMYHEGASEDAVRNALVERYPRDRFLLADKLPTFMIDRPVQMEVIFKEQLKKSGVSYFDYYMLHCVWESRYDAQIKDGVCPQSISISDILATYNSIMRQESPLSSTELNYYKRIQERRHGANLCEDCGKCSAVCPEHLDVPAKLRRTAKFQYVHSFW